MKTYIRLLGIVALLVCALTIGAVTSASAADYSNNNMMDDGVFNNANTMGSAVTSLVNPPASDYAQITNFLNGSDGKLGGPSNCLAHFTDQNWYYDGTNFHYGDDGSWNTAWGPAHVSAAQIIYTAAHMWGINPQVILATLQKEEGLVSGPGAYGCANSSSPDYQSAMGYGCPDSGGCNARYAGFTRQVLWGSWQLMFDEQRSEGNLGWLGNGDLSYVGFFSNGAYQALPYKRCNSCTGLPNAYSTPATIDGQSITIANGATAALFTYTPHLSQSFPSLFEGWFGSVLYHGDDPVGSLDLVQQAPSAVRVAGWGLDRSLNGPASIHVYVDGTLEGAITANTSRPDVGVAYPSMGNNHGFDGTIPWTTAGTHQVCAWVVGDNIGAPNYGLGCKAIFINNDPVGSFDLTQQTPQAVRVAGWGLDRSFNGSASIHVYVDGTLEGAITANTSRPDVGVAYPSMGNNHGFDGTIPWTTAGTHQVCAWVVGDNIGAPNYGLGCKAIFINNDPVGSLDIVQTLPGAIRVAGWGLDRSMAGPAAIHVYIDGVFSTAITANVNRGDVGAHGFDSNITWSAPGSHQVCAWVVGDNIGAPNYGLGCKSVTF